MDITKSGIYGIINIINNKIYIGSTKNFYKRKSQHFSTLKFNKHSNRYLQSAYNKYGKDSFKFIILERNISIEKLIERELYWINLKESLDRNKGYNLSIPDINTLHTHSQETKDLLQRLAYENHYGTEYSEEEYVNWLNRPKNQSDLTREEYLNQFKILQLDKYTGNIIKEFNQVKDISNLYNLSVNKIKDVIQGRRKSYKGYVYIHKNKYDESKNYIVKRNNIYKVKPIYQYDKEKVFMRKWDNIHDILEEYMNFNKISLQTAFSKKPNLYKGYYWYRSRK